MRIFTFLFIFLSSLSAHASSEKTMQDSDIKYLTHLKQNVWPTIYKKSDVAGLDELTHPNFVIVDNQGNTTSKTEELSFLKTYTWPHDEFEYDIQRLNIFENKTAIVAGQGKASGKNEKGDYCFTYISTNVLIKIKGRWKAIQSHVSGYQPSCK